MSEELKNRFAISPLFDAEIDVTAANWVALSPLADHELRVSVTAAVIAHRMGYRSVDRVIKNYLQDANEHHPRDSELRQHLDEALDSYKSFFSSFPPRSDEKIGVFAFDLAFVRSCESVKSLYILARQGFLIEPSLIARALLEQYDYAYRVWPIEDDDDDAIFSTKPQSSISYLKELNPKIGRAYGLLSELAHYNPTMHMNFISMPSDEPSDSTLALQRSWSFKIVSLAWTFFIIELQYRVFKSRYGDHPNFGLVSHLEEKTLPLFDAVFAGVEETVEFIRELIVAFVV